MKITPIKDCVNYIVGCGFTFEGKAGRNTYVFRKNVGTMPNGSDVVFFTLSELRHAEKFGW